MKKLLTLACAMTAATAAMAQGPENKSVVFQKTIRATVAEAINTAGMAELKSALRDARGAMKGAAAGTRYYSQANSLVEGSINASLQSTANTSIIPIWFDSTILVRYTNGLLNIDFSSINQYFDPITSDLFNDEALYGSEIQILPTDAYRVDSIAFFAGYVRLQNKANIVDTLILSVSSDANTAYRLTRTGYTAGAPYLPAGSDTLILNTILNVDSVNRAGFASVAGTGGARAFWKVPLTAANGDTLSSTGGIPLRRFAFRVPTNGLTIPAGSRFNVTATFKSGDNWVRNQDSLNGFNRWMPVTFGTAGRMPYYFYQLGRDRNNSGLMFSTDTTTYYPSVLVETFQNGSTAFDYEFHDIEAFINCATCNTVQQNANNASVDGASAPVVGTVFPNPAADQFTIPIVLNTNAEVTVTLSNTVGQVVATQSLGKVAAGAKQAVTFSTTGLPNGVYMYTVDAAGARKSGRVVVAH